MLRDGNDVDDVVQDAFALAHERLTKLREPSAFRGWLMQIAVRLVHRRFRRKKMLAMLGFVAMPDKEPGLVEEARADLGPEARLDLRRIDVALGQVADTDRMAWLLRHVDGLALEDVAAACDCSLATVKRRVSRAQERVRAVLGYELEGGRDES
jgi:RNA polymerase sigma-70 factor (ECF subfamily)